MPSPHPRRPAPRPLLALLPAALAGAGYDKIATFGGTTGPGQSAEALGSVNSGGYAPPGRGPGGASSKGVVTASFLWVRDSPQDDPPPAVVVKKTASANASGGAPAAADGLGHAPFTMGTTVFSVGSAYEVQGGESFEVKVQPSASASDDQGGTCGVSVIVSCAPVRITLSGVLNPKTDKRLLIGQRLGATVSGAPSGSTYTWIVGGGPFTSYTPSTPASQFVGYNPPSASSDPSTACHFRSPGAKSVQCSVYLAALGQTVALSENVTAVAPEFYAWSVQGQADFVTVNAGTSEEQPPGMHLWGATYTDAEDNEVTFGIFLIAWVSTPADFVSQGQGGVQWAQLVTKLNSWAHEEDGGYQDVDNPFVGVNKLDGSYPYLGRTFDADGARYFVEDAPGMSLDGLNEAYFTSTHQDYLNYLPGGSGSQLVPLARFDWSWMGHASLVDDDWAFVSRSKSCQYTSSFPLHPMWTSVASPPTYHPRS